MRNSRLLEWIQKYGLRQRDLSAMLGEFQKFGLRHHDLPAMVGNVACMLRLLTLNIDSRHRKRIPAILYLFTLACMASYVYELLVSPVWLIFFRPGSSVLEKLYNLAGALSEAIGMVQFICMYWNRKELQKIVSAYLYCDAQVATNSQMARSTSVTLRVVKRRAVGFFTMVTINGLLYIFIPYAVPGRRLENDFQILGLEPMYKSPNFEISRVLHTLTTILVVTGPTSITVFFIIIVGYTEAQMIALSQEITNLWENAQTDYKQNHLNDTVTVICKEALINSYIKRRLEVIIETHAVNQQLINQVEVVFRNSFALKFLVLSITLITGLLCGLENTYIFLPYAMVLVAMDCMTGQRLLDASLVFEVAVYRCHWERLDARNMKLVLVLMRSAQKTMRLTAGGVSTLSYETLMVVIKFVYSTYTTFRSMIHE